MKALLKTSRQEQILVDFFLYKVDLGIEGKADTMSRWLFKAIMYSNLNLNNY